MNQATLLRESRSRHLLQSYEAAVKQLRVFREVLPITTKNSESSVSTNTRAHKARKLEGLNRNDPKASATGVPFTPHTSLEG